MTTTTVGIIVGLLAVFGAGIWIGRRPKGPKLTGHGHLSPMNMYREDPPEPMEKQKRDEAIFNVLVILVLVAILAMIFGGRYLGWWGR